MVGLGWLGTSWDPGRVASSVQFIVGLGLRQVLPFTGLIGREKRIFHRIPQRFHAPLTVHSQQRGDIKFCTLVFPRFRPAAVDG